MSAGSTSCVNWMRRKPMPSAVANALASVVFAMPGTPSRRTCPRARAASSRSSTVSSYPTTTRPISRRIAAVSSARLTGAAILRLPYPAFARFPRRARARRARRGPRRPGTQRRTLRPAAPRARRSRRAARRPRKPREGARPSRATLRASAWARPTRRAARGRARAPPLRRSRARPSRPRRSGARRRPARGSGGAATRPTPRARRPPRAPSAPTARPRGRPPRRPARPRPARASLAGPQGGVHEIRVPFGVALAQRLLERGARRVRLGLHAEEPSAQGPTRVARAASRGPREEERRPEESEEEDRGDGEHGQARRALGERFARGGAVRFVHADRAARSHEARQAVAHHVRAGRALPRVGEERRVAHEDHFARADALPREPREARERARWRGAAAARVEEARRARGGEDFGAGGREDRGRVVQRDRGRVERRRVHDGVRGRAFEAEVQHARTEAARRDAFEVAVRRARLAREEQRAAPADERAQPRLLLG